MFPILGCILKMIIFVSLSNGSIYVISSNLQNYEHFLEPPHCFIHCFTASIPYLFNISISSRPWQSYSDLAGSGGGGCLSGRICDQRGYPV